jgi:hypothetical protein
MAARQQGSKGARQLLLDEDVQKLAASMSTFSSVVIAPCVICTEELTRRLSAWVDVCDENAQTCKVNRKAAGGSSQRLMVELGDKDTSICRNWEIFVNQRDTLHHSHTLFCTLPAFLGGFNFTLNSLELS